MINIEHTISELKRYSTIYAVMLLKPDQYNQSSKGEVLRMLNDLQKKIDEFYINLRTNPPNGSHWSKTS